MGQDFRAMLGHSMTAEGIFTLPTRLNGITPGSATELVAIGMGTAFHWSWWDAPSQLDEFRAWLGDRIREDGVATAWAAEELWIHVTPCVLELGSWVRWRELTSSDELQRSLRSLSAKVAALVGATSVYYLPDNACEESGLAGDVMFSGGTIEQVAEALQRAGPPRASIAQAASGGYFVERLPPH
jgi:hypothetical protein